MNACETGVEREKGIMDGKKLEYKGEKALEEVEKLTMNAGEIQDQILEEILRRNWRTEYLYEYLRGSRNKEEFKRRVPVVSYDDIKPLIQRIANGEHYSLISGDPITELLTSSGTSGGESKLMPSIAEDIDRRTYLYNLLMPIMNKHVSGLDMGKAMYLYFVKAETSTPSGLPARPVLTSYYKSEHFRHRPFDPYNNLTSPDKTILCQEISQSMYCQLLCGLIFRQKVLRLGAVFASAFLRAINFLEQNWQRMCVDIETGNLDPLITDPGCLEAMSRVLRPDPQLSTEISRLCERECWGGILCELWPKAKYIEVIVTGSMSQYIPALNYYSGGRLPLVSTMYASSESYFGVNLEPLCEPASVAYTLLPNMAYFEFAPIAKGEGTVSEEPVSLVDVEVGRFYELIVTNFAGLYRYRIGDVVQVTGFHNQAPQFRFICRRDVILSIDTDKTTEEDLHRAVASAKKLLEPSRLFLVEYTSYADTSSIPGHYVLFWEIGPATSVRLSPHNSVMEACCANMEQSLGDVYRRCRSTDKSVGPLEIRLVCPGTFDALMDLSVSNGGSVNQYKTPRGIRSGLALELLNSRVTSNFLSPRDPMWMA
ncbi:hypothetical protein AMTRI_Chr02g265470 [Amborella trichopoda]